MKEIKRTIMIILASIIHILYVHFSEVLCFSRFLSHNSWGWIDEWILLITVLFISGLDFFVVNYKLHSVLNSYIPKILLAAFGFLEVAVMLYLIFAPNPILNVKLQDCLSVLFVQAMILFNCIWVAANRINKPITT